MLLTVLSLEAVVLGAVDGGAVDGSGAVDGLTGTISADTIPLGALRDRSSLGGAADGLGACGAVDGLTGTISADTTPLGALRDRSSLGGEGGDRGRGSFFLGGIDPMSYTSGLFGAASTGP